MTTDHTAAIEAVAEALTEREWHFKRVPLADDGRHHILLPAEDIARLAVETAAPIIERAALLRASEMLMQWADDMGDVGFTGPASARKRAIQACARKIAPKLTTAEAAAALVDLLTGKSEGFACHLDDAGRAIPPTGRQL